MTNNDILICIISISPQQLAYDQIVTAQKDPNYRVDITKSISSVHSQYLVNIGLILATVIIMLVGNPVSDCDYPFYVINYVSMCALMVAIRLLFLLEKQVTKWGFTNVDRSNFGAFFADLQQYQQDIAIPTLVFLAHGVFIIYSCIGFIREDTCSIRNNNQYLLAWAYAIRYAYQWYQSYTQQQQQKKN